MSAAVHLSAQDALSLPLMEFSGTLLHPAEARCRMLEGHHSTLPVLCMDIELDNPLRTRLHVEQPYPADQHAQALAAAKRYRKGTHITLQTRLPDVQLVARNVCSIAMAPCAATGAADTSHPNAPINDLFQETAP